MKLRRIAIFASAFVLAAAAEAQVSLREIEAQFPECAGMFTQADVDELSRAAEDPKEGFERWRRHRLTLSEEPPLMVCRSRIWRSLHGTDRKADPGREAEAGGSSLRGMFAASAKIGDSQAMDSGVDDYQGETFLAVHPKDSLRLVAGSNTFDPGDLSCRSPSGQNQTFGTQALFQSADGGKSWVHQCAPWHPDVTGGIAGAVIWFGSDPSLAWDANGNAYAAYMLLSMNQDYEAGTAIVVARSEGGQAPWTPWSVVVNNMKDGPYNDKEMLAIDTSSGGAFSHPGRLYVIWDQDYAIRVAHSDDGTSWTTKVIGSAPGYHKGGNLAVGADGTVYAVWNEIYETDKYAKADPDRIWTSRSIDGGDTWTKPVKALTLHRASFGWYYLPAAQNENYVTSITSIGIDRNPQSHWFGRLYLTWADSTPSCCPPDPFSQIDVYSSYSNDGGDTWAPPVRVNDDEKGTTHFNPSLSVDPSDGTVHVAWYDTRDDPDQEQTRVYTARSGNGGSSWEPNLNFLAGGAGADFNNLVDFSNLNTLSNQQANPNQHGEYLGIAAVNRKVHAVWTDSRQFFPDFNFDVRREDAAMATVTYCTAPSWFKVQGSSSTPPDVPLQAAGTVGVSWPSVTSWGINGMGGTYTLLRYTGSGCLGKPVTVLTTSALSATDAPSAAGTYSYRVRAENNCPGTKLTPMATLSECSAAVSFKP